MNHWFYNGNILINLENGVNIVIRDNFVNNYDCAVVHYAPMGSNEDSYQTWLFEGTREECERYIHDLASSLDAINQPAEGTPQPEPKPIPEPIHWDESGNIGEVDYSDIPF